MQYIFVGAYSVVLIIKGMKKRFATTVSLLPLSGSSERGDDSGTGLIALTTNTMRSKPDVRLIFLKV